MRGLAFYIVPCLALIIMGYLNGKLSAATELNNLKGQMGHAEKEAQKKLDDALAAHQALALLYTEAYTKQEKQDEAAKTEIQRLNDELSHRPVRVRIETESRACDSDPTTPKDKNPHPSNGSESSTYGLLPSANTERLRSAIKEIETLNAAYASCKKALLLAGATE